MRSLLAASASVLMLLAASTVASLSPSYPAPNLVYTAQPLGTYPKGSLCYATGQPASNPGDQVSLFTVYNCGSKSGVTNQVGFMDLDDKTNTVLATSSFATKKISYTSVVATKRNHAMAWASGDPADWEIVGVRTQAGGVPLWKVEGTGWVNSTPTFSTDDNAAFFAVNEEVRSVDLDTGKTNWNHTFAGVQALSSIVYIKDAAAVYWISEPKGSVPMLNKKASGSKNQYKTDSVPNPCNITAAAGEHFQLKSIKFGADANGDLNGLFMYGNYKETKAGTGDNFVVCRVSHHNLNQAKMSWGFADRYQVYGVTGGDNATIFNVYNMDKKIYEVLILNQTQTGPNKYFTVPRQHITRTSNDKRNNPVIVYGGEGESPRLFMQRTMNGDRLTAYDTWRKYVKPAFANPLGCWLTPNVVDHAGTSRIFCLDETDKGGKSKALSKAATSLDYNGEVIWEQAGIAAGFPAVNMQNSYVAFQLVFNIVGFSFDPDIITNTPGSPKPAAGPSGAIIALVIIILLFAVALGVILFKIWGQKTTRRTASRMQLDKEGYAGLNA